eukprot:scaffold11422_cov71-Phaeocystis_antarctica.AAC.4
MLELLRGAIVTVKKRAALTRTTQAPVKLTVQRFTGAPSLAGAAAVFCLLLLRLLCLLLGRQSSQLLSRRLSLHSVVEKGGRDSVRAQLVDSLNLAVLYAGRTWAYKRDGDRERMTWQIAEYRVQWDGKSCGQGPGYAVKQWLSNRVSRKPDDIPSRGLLQRLAGAAPRDDNIVRLGKHVCIMHKPCKCAHAYCKCTCGHYMFTSSGAETAAGLEAAEERLRSTESWEAAAESLGPVAGCEAAVENLGPAGRLVTAAAYELDLITAGEAAAQLGSRSSATAGPGAGAGAATSDAAAVVATALDAAATSDAGSIAFERVALASASALASSSSMKRTPSASTALTGPVRPQTVMCLALECAHASANVRGLVTASA